MTDTEGDGTSGTWEGATIKALRIAKGLTQDALAVLARIDRSRLNGIENGHYRVTPYYANKLAPHLGVEPEELLPPEVLGEAPGSPLALLRQLGETVDAHQGTIDALEERVSALESAGGNAGRSHESGR